MFKVGDRVKLTRGVLNGMTQEEYRLYADKVLTIVAVGNDMARARLNEKHSVVFSNSTRFFSKA